MRTFGIVCLLMFCLSANDIFSQDIRLNEIVASNSEHLDEDGDTPDWIELHNFGASDISLENWSITDDKNDPQKWIFPSTTLLSDDYLLLWASDKDRKERSYSQSIITEGDTFKYTIPTSTITAPWQNLDFDDSNWDEGNSGFGYGDDDDETVVPEGTTSIYIRKKFNINSLEDILDLYLHVDFDDGFVAYLNGIEITRENLPNGFIDYNTFAVDFIEPLLFQGMSPFEYQIFNFQNILNVGENVLAIQVHNYSLNSSDLTIIPFLSSLSNTISLPPAPSFLNLPNKDLHTNFKLSSEQETVYLFSPTGTLVDSMAFSNLPRNISKGIDENQMIAYFENTTPRMFNGSGSQGIFEGTIIFSREGGLCFPCSTFDVSLTGNPPGSEIRYTLDHTIPNQNSPLYTQPISISKIETIRARIFQQNFIPSKTQTQTYLFNIDHDLPVVSLVTEPDNFFSEETGIHTFGNSYEMNFPHFGANFWEDWEKDIHFSIYETNGDHFSFNGGVKIFGGWSRGQDQKSLSIFARKKYGPDKIDYPLFPNRDYDSYQSIVLRNSGNDFLNSNMRDGALTSSMESANIEVQAYKPTVTYLNGEYWGILNLREKSNEHFLAAKFNDDPDKIDLLELDAVTLHGSNEDYNNLIDFVESTNLSSENNYNSVAREIDIDNIIIYHVAQIYFDNTDWPGNNIKYWRPENGKWRWILYDTDFGFGIWNTGNYVNNTLNHALQANGPGWPNPPWSTLLFRRLMDNTKFRNKFINQMADEMNSRFLPINLSRHFEDLKQNISSEIQNHFIRWNANFGEWNNNLNEMNNFGIQRPFWVKEHILDRFNLPNYHTIRINNTQTLAGFVQINSLSLKAFPWFGDYFERVPIKVSAIPNSGFSFSHWEGDISGTDPIVMIDMQEDMNITPIFISSSDNPKVVINEINYNSAMTNDSEDWIELYNGSNDVIDLSDWVFKDANDANSFSIPENTFIAPNDYLVIARDINKFQTIHADVTQVIGNFDFGLSSDVDQIRIYDREETLIDFVEYSSTSPWPEQPNGNGPTLELIHPNLDNALPESWARLHELGSPGIANADNVSTEEVAIPIVTKIYPNPFVDFIEIEIEFDENPVDWITLELRDTESKLVKTLFSGRLSSNTFRQSYNLENISSGIYQLIVTDKTDRSKAISCIKI